ncbi:MAG: plastocyanin/azurin family copper-binding protein [Planctomycetaceae bacterium]
MQTTLILSISSAAAADEKNPAQPAANTGTIQGTVSYTSDAKRPWRYARYYVDDKNAGRLAESLVCLRLMKPTEGTPKREQAKVVIDQKDFRFIPETIAIRAGDRVKFTNSDFSVHNVSTNNDLHPFDLTLGHDDEAVEAFPRAGGPRRPIVIGCKFHGSMRAWIYVFDHPWYQVTAADGAFSLKEVPAGVYQLEMVHSAGQLRWNQRVEIAAGQTHTMAITVSPDNLFVGNKQ